MVNLVWVTIENKLCAARAVSLPHFIYLFLFIYKYIYILLCIYKIDIYL